MPAVHDDRFTGCGVRLVLHRERRAEGGLPGGKWRKLKYNAEAAAGRPVLTFGGAHSNHLRATAALGRRRGFPTIGVVRGEHRPTPVLAAAARDGMTLRYVTRTEYRQRADPRFADRLRDEFGDFHLVPEGGANAYGVRGCAELPATIDGDFDVLACAVGTGTMLAGVAAALRPGQEALGFAVLKGGGFLRDEVARLQESAGMRTGNWSVETDYHCGGYARRTAALDAFADDFHDRHGVALDRVYEAKMMYGLLDVVRRGRLRPGCTVVALIV